MTRRDWVLFAAVGVIWDIPYALIEIANRRVSVPVLAFARGGGAVAGCGTSRPAGRATAALAVDRGAVSGRGHPALAGAIGAVLGAVSWRTAQSWTAVLTDSAS
jgi:hypothetical protein